MITLHAHQARNVEGLYQALKTYGSALDASQVGTGKTFSAIGICKKVGARPCIITRKAVVPSWVDACAKMGVTPLFIVNYEALLTEGFSFCLKEKIATAKPDGTPTGFTRKFKGWNLPDNRVIFIWDECQALRNPGSFVSKAAVGASLKFKTLLLSATPAQTPLEMQAIGAILKLFAPSGAYPWLLRHGCKKSIFGPLEFIGDQKDKAMDEPGTNMKKGEAVMRKIGGDIFPARGVRTLRNEIPGFPESQVTAEAIETGESNDIQKFYLQELEGRKKFDHEKACEGVDEEFHHLVDVMPVTVNLRLRMEIELRKAAALAELAQSAVECGEKVVIVVSFDSTIEVLRRMLKTDVVIRGVGKGRSDLPRHASIQKFQANNSDYIIVNATAGGTGLSLHDPVGKKPRTCLICPPPTAVLLRQIVGRVWRVGGGYSRQRILFAAGTVEDKMMKRLEGLSMNLDALVDSDLDPIEYL